MKKIVKNFLAGDSPIPKLNLKQTRFTCSTCGRFPNHRKRIQKFRETGGVNTENKLGKACFAHDAAYFDSKDLAKITISDKTFKLLEILNVMDIKED